MYPMKMVPVYKDYLWGGEQLANKYHKETSVRPLAESWEISCHPAGLSKIENGEFAGLSLAEIIEKNPIMMGDLWKKEEGFPILIKLIDAKQNLSIQVHPDDRDALQMEGKKEGKNEMWYIMDALPNAKICIGFKRQVSQEELRRRIDDNTLLEIVKEMNVKPGDCYIIPAGMLHAIGEGVMVAEVQQSSNITYRIYDYGRKDKEGKLRELHVEKALAVLDQSLQPINTGAKPLVQKEGYKIRCLADWQWFQTDQIIVDTEAQRICNKDSFVALLCTEGIIRVWSGETEVILKEGESGFLPAGLGSYLLKGRGVILETSIRRP